MSDWPHPDILASLITTLHPDDCKSHVWTRLPGKHATGVVADRCALCGSVVFPYLEPADGVPN